MDDKYYLERLERYMAENNLTRTQLAKELNMTPNALYYWFSGRTPISKRGKAAITVITSTMLDNEAPICPIPECPARSADRLLQFVLENWNTTSAKTRGNICSLIESERLEKNNPENITPPQK